MMFFQIAHKAVLYLVYFCNKTVIKIFKKLPNLATLNSSLSPPVVHSGAGIVMFQSKSTKDRKINFNSRASFKLFSA